MNLFASEKDFPELANAVATAFDAQGRFLLNNTIGLQGILQHTVSAVGSGYEGTEIEPLPISSDPHFRPVDMEFGPDGALHLTDWQEALIGHMQYSIRDPLRDRTHARIWRITYPSRPLLTPVAIAGAPLPQLLNVLKHPEQHMRIRAKQEIATRPVADVVAAVGHWVAGLDAQDANYHISSPKHCGFTNA